jgi:6,7-dimethyl-8-ribityllumazine synthase
MWVEMGLMIDGDLNAEGMRFAIVVAKFNDFVTLKLLDGAKSALLENGVDQSDITVAMVPGSFEIPVVADHLASSGNYDAIICLGAVIKGETDHYEYVSKGAAEGIARVALDNQLPVMFGVLTTHDVEQALDRCGGRKGNEGESSAISAIKTINVLRHITSNS